MSLGQTKEYHKKYWKIWYQRNKEKRLRDVHEYLQKPEVKERQKKYLKKYGKEYRKKHKKKISLLLKAYYKKHFVSKRIPLEIRFWNFVKKGGENDCWIWIGTKYPKTGYGRLSRFYAHRFSYELHKGKIPKGICVCHTCDKPPCVNPKHLWLGTMTENMKDRDRKGRHKNGGQKKKTSVAIKKVICYNRRT